MVWMIILFLMFLAVAIGSIFVFRWLDMREHKKSISKNTNRAEGLSGYKYTYKNIKD